MKSRLLVLFLLALTFPFLIGSTLPGKYSLIVPYQAPPKNSLSQVRVYEVFAFDCVHCYKFHHRERAALIRKFGKKVKFISRPIGWRGEDPGRLYFIAEELQEIAQNKKAGNEGKAEKREKIGEEALHRLFSAVRSGIDLYNNRELLKRVATDFIGLSEKEYAKIDNPKIIKKMKASMEYAKTRGITSTPTVVVEDVLVADKNIKNLTTIINYLLKEPVP